MRPRSADRERGVALPPWAIGVSIGVVVVAMLTFVITGGPDRSDEATANPTSESSTAPSDDAAGDDKASAEPSEQPSEPAESEPSKAPGSERERSETSGNFEKAGHKVADQQTAQDRSAYVEVYNNSTVSGLANETAAELQDAGWEVVGADNWYGDIPDSTVYYPSRLHDVAKLLATDLGVARLHTAVAPMKFDRLTVILTGPL